MNIELLHTIASIDIGQIVNITADNDLPGDDPAQAPPGTKGKVSLIISWMKWGGWIGCAVGLIAALVIWAVPDWVPGGDKAVKNILQALLAAAGIGAVMGIIGVLAA